MTLDEFVDYMIYQDSKITAAIKTNHIKLKDYRIFKSNLYDVLGYRGHVSDTYTFNFRENGVSGALRFRANDSEKFTNSNFDKFSFLVWQRLTSPVQQLTLF